MKRISFLYRFILVIAVLSLLFSLGGCKQPASGTAMQQLSASTTHSFRYLKTKYQPPVPPPAPAVTRQEKIERIRTVLHFDLPHPDLDFQQLQQTVNPDIYAWLYVPGTKIDNPVLQHPSQHDFYLMHNLDGSYGYPGCIYSQLYNKNDFQDQITLLYAHDMPNETMFGGLEHFSEKAFFRSHRYLFVYLPDDILVYEIYSSFLNDTTHVLLGYDWSDTGFTAFMDFALHSLGERNQALSDYTVTPQDHILILSTCFRQSSLSHRRLVLAKQLDINQFPLC